MTKKGHRGGSEKKEQAVTKQPSVTKDDIEEEEINSGFGNYLKSSSGQEMLRMFVVVNSIVMFLTIAWPQMKSSYEFITQVISENFGSVQLF